MTKTPKNNNESPLPSKWQSSILFFISFFLLVSFLIAFIVIPQINKIFEDNLETKSKSNLKLQVKLLERFIEEKKNILNDIASNPSLTNALMLNSLDNPSFIDYFNNVKISGTKPSLIIQDLEGNLMSHKGLTKGKYSKKESWVKKILSGAIPYHFELLSNNENNIINYKISVPILYNGNIEGLLSAEIKEILEEVFNPDSSSDVSFKLTQGQIVIETDSSNIAIPKENSFKIKNSDVTFSLITDQALYKQKAFELRNTILVVLFVGFLASFILYAVFEYKILSSKNLKNKNGRKNQNFLIPTLVGIIGISASITGFFIVVNLERNKQEIEFYSESKSLTQSIHERIKDNQDVLHSLKAFYDASEFVDREEFREFTKPLLQGHPNIRSLQWAPYVSKIKRKEFEERAQDEGFDNFTFIDKDDEGNLIPAPIQDEYYPVYYLEPFESNRVVFGLAPSYHEERRQAIYKARDTGNAVATNPISLTQDNQEKEAYLIFLPVYNDAPSYKTIKMRREHFKGNVLLVLLVDDVIQSTLNSNKSSKLLINIKDVTNPEKPQQIYNSNYHKESVFKNLSYKENLNIAGRKWHIEIKPYKGYFSAKYSPFSLLVLFFGLALSIMISFTLGQLIRRNKKVEDLVEQRTIQLKESEERYEIAVHGSSVGLWDWNVKTNQLYWSPRFKEIVGISDKDFIPHLSEFEDRLHPEDHDRIMEALVEGHIKNKKPYDVEYRLKHNNGNYVWIHARGQALWDKDGKPTRVAGSVDDISEKKKSEIELSESKNFLELMTKNNPDLIFVKDEEFKIIQANQQFLNVYPKEKRNKVIGYTTLEQYDEDERNQFLEMDKKAFEEGYSDTIEKVNFPDGNERTLYTQKIRFYNSEGKKFILGIGRDVTEREKLINRLTDSNEELERFAFICSHDLQEPLRMIRSFSEKLQEHMGENFEKDEKGKKYFRFITDGAARAQNLIQDILAYSSVDSDTQKLEKVNPEELINVIEDSMSINLEKTGGKITFDKLPEISGNKTQLFQLFQNLINNGLKYQKPKNSPHVHISAIEKEKHWQFSIKDNGIGIEERHLNKIFEIFHRLHSKNQYAGTGIGLSICKKIVERYGGKIWVESTPEEGSTFHFTILKAN